MSIFLAENYNLLAALIFCYTLMISAVGSNSMLGLASGVLDKSQCGQKNWKVAILTGETNYLEDLWQSLPTLDWRTLLDEDHI